MPSIQSRPPAGPNPNHSRKRNCGTQSAQHFIRPEVGCLGRLTSRDGQHPGPRLGPRDGPSHDWCGRWGQSSREANRLNKSLTSRKHKGRLHCPVWRQGTADHSRFLPRATVTETQPSQDNTIQDRLAGLLLGTAVGDSIGLPAEGLSRRRRQRLLAKLAPADREWGDLADRMAATWARKDAVAAFASTLGLNAGVTGYVYHTAPVAVYAWLRHYGDFRTSVEAALDCGGDTDTVGAIIGALAGGAVGAGGIPNEWIAGLIEACTTPIRSFLETHSTTAYASRGAFSFFLQPITRDQTSASSTAICCS